MISNTLRIFAMAKRKFPITNIPVLSSPRTDSNLCPYITFLGEKQSPPADSATTEQNHIPVSHISSLKKFARNLCLIATDPIFQPIDIKRIAKLSHCRSASAFQLLSTVATRRDGTTIKRETRMRRILSLGVLLFLIAALGCDERMIYLDLAWDANQEPDLAGYKVYYGTSSREYINSVDVGNVTSYRLDNLLEDVIFYVAVTAYDTAGNESDFSEEVAGVGVLGDSLVDGSD
jgi:hypothetical protein